MQLMPPPLPPMIGMIEFFAPEVARSRAKQGDRPHIDSTLLLARHSWIDLVVRRWKISEAGHTDQNTVLYRRKIFLAVSGLRLLKPDLGGSGWPYSFQSQQGLALELVW